MKRVHIRFIAYLIISCALLFQGLHTYSQEHSVDTAVTTNNQLSTLATPDTTVEPYAFDQLYPVVSVADGDTISVDINGKTEKIRMIGVDTPESVDPRKPVQCFGKEASNFTKGLLSNQFVHLESDDSQDDRDKYGRLLRYVYLPDGTLYNQLLISAGYGHEYTYQVPYKFQKEFKSAQLEAERGLKGLWSPDTCAGKK